MRNSRKSFTVFLDEGMLEIYYLGSLDQALEKVSRGYSEYIRYRRKTFDAEGSERWEALKRNPRYRVGRPGIGKTYEKFLSIIRKGKRRKVVSVTSHSALGRSIEKLKRKLSKYHPVIAGGVIEDLSEVYRKWGGRIFNICTGVGGDFCPSFVFLQELLEDKDENIRILSRTSSGIEEIKVKKDRHYESVTRPGIDVDPDDKILLDLAYYGGSSAFITTDGRIIKRAKNCKRINRYIPILDVTDSEFNPEKINTFRKDELYEIAVHVWKNKFKR